MKKFKSMMYWFGVLVAYLVAFALFGMIIVFMFDLPNTMFSGFFAWSFIICGMLFTADDETRDVIKKIIKNEK